ncbi:MAG: GNAT family N-acetyltransferase [Actinobacteria bacterium]|nr:GNAT family N-acetyltransferase [Actinomycetota bacterium]
MTTAPPERVAELEIETLDAKHADALVEHFERCTDYFETVLGHPPGPAERQSTFIALPEGKTYDDKFTFVFIFESKVVGDLDLIRDYPESGEWWLGVLLLDPSIRSMGLGSDILEAFSNWVAENGGRAIRLAVASKNPEGLRFWQHRGFVEIERKENVPLGVWRDDLIIMRRPTDEEP